MAWLHDRSSILTGSRATRLYFIIQCRCFSSSCFLPQWALERIRSVVDPEEEREATERVRTRVVQGEGGTRAVGRRTIYEGELAHIAQKLSRGVHHSRWHRKCGPPCFSAIQPLEFLLFSRNENSVKNSLKERSRDFSLSSAERISSFSSRHISTLSWRLREIQKEDTGN